MKKLKFMFVALPTYSPNLTSMQEKNTVNYNIFPPLGILSLASRLEDDVVEDSRDEIATDSEVPNQEFVPVASAPEMSMPISGGAKIVFKNAKIYAEKVIIKKK